MSGRTRYHICEIVIVCVLVNEYNQLIEVWDAFWNISVHTNYVSGFPMWNFAEGQQLFVFLSSG